MSEWVSEWTGTSSSSESGKMRGGRDRYSCGRMSQLQRVDAEL